MKLIFIRHAEPDYSIDSLTEKGFDEAAFLAKRTTAWNVTQFYCSPLGRAQKTAGPTLSMHEKEAITLDFLQEFHAPVTDPLKTDEKRIPWDLMPDYLSQNPILFDPHNWWQAPIMQTGDVKKEYDRVCNGLDKILAEYGYTRCGFHYKTSGNNKPSNAFMKYDGTTKDALKNAPDTETILVIFCHLGVMMAMLSHLINTSPCTLWQGMFIPPSSVTVVSAEERIPGSAYFRCQCVGDTSHLLFNNEEVSYYGGFSRPFMG